MQFIKVNATLVFLLELMLYVSVNKVPVMFVRFPVSNQYFNAVLLNLTQYIASAEARTRDLLILARATLYH